MKKILSLCLMAAAVVMASCSSCGTDNQKQETIDTTIVAAGTDYDGVVPDLTLGAEHIVALHRQQMYTLAEGRQVYWYETKYLFTDDLTSETLADAHITDVTDIFQVFQPEQCWQITTNAVRGTLVPQATPGLWIEDMDLADAEIKLTIADVLQRLAEVNTPLPEGVHQITLRLPVGPRQCHAQYIFGDVFNPLFIDAVTGEVTDWNPAFPRKE